MLNGMRAHLETQALHLDIVFFLNRFLFALLGAALQCSFPLLLGEFLASSVELLVSDSICLGLQLNLLLFQRSKNTSATTREHWLFLLQERHDRSLGGALSQALGLLRRLVDGLSIFASAFFFGRPCLLCILCRF